MTWKGWEDFTPPLDSRTGVGGLVVIGQADPASSKPSKYRAVKETIDGITFDSKREAARYRDLVLRMKAGDIRRLRCQPRYALCPLIIEEADARDINAGVNSLRRLPICDYIADFEYEESDRGYGGIVWRLIVEDVKGVRTDVYKLKKRWFQTQYGMQIREIR